MPQNNINGKSNGNLSSVEVQQPQFNPALSVNSSGWNNDNQVNLDKQPILSSARERRGWKTFTSQERCLYISLGIVSLIALGLMAGVGVLSFQIKDDDDVGIATKVPNTTILPPWLTISPTTTTETTTTTTTLAPGWNTCFTPECTLAAGNMLRSMSTNSKVKPCDDFFEYACGGWMEQNPVSELEANFLDQNSILEEALSKHIRSILESEISEDLEPQLLSQQFYEACLAQVDPADSANLVKYMDFLLGDTDLTKVFGRIRRYLGGNFIFTTNIGFDEFDTQNITLVIDQPAFGLQKEHLVKETESFVKAYKEVIQKTWTTVIGGSDSVAIADKIVAFETELAKISATEEDRENRTATNVPKLVAELYELNEDGESKIDWVSYWTELYALTPVPPPTPFMENLPTNWREATVIVRDLNYFIKLETLLAKEPEKDIRNFLKWRILFAVGNEYSQPIRDIFAKFYQVTQKDFKVETKRWKTCVDKTNSYFGMAISYFYAQKHFSEEHKINADAMVQDLKDAFDANLLEIDWMTEETKAFAAEKIRNLTTFVAYPDWLLVNVTDPIAVNETEFTILDYYQDLALSSSNDHFQNVVDILEWRSERELITFGDLKDTKRWTVEPTNMKSLYSSIYNSITVPVGILQAPLYGASLQYLNYGAIGAIIAHELTHGFDLKGQESDSAGDLNAWWDDCTHENFTERVQCFVDQYNAYEYPEFSLKLNGLQTLRENLADNGGLRLALLAYRRFVDRGNFEKILPGYDSFSFTTEQLFYLSYAQQYCSAYKKEYIEDQIKTGVQSPARFRVQGVVQNSIDFALAWSCPTPAVNEVCRLW